jgi:hypothetical protein
LGSEIDHETSFKRKNPGVRCRCSPRSGSGARANCLIHHQQNIQDGGLTITFSSNFTGGADPASFCGTDPVCLNRQSTVFIDLHASAIATATCVPPGHGASSGKQVTLSAPIGVAASAVTSPPLPSPPGVIYGVALTTPPPSNLTIAGAPDCPNRNWSEIITDLAFTNATFSLTQGTPAIASGQLVCSFNPPTTDGPLTNAEIDRSCTAQ